MRIYPDVPSGIAGQGFTLCVEPNSRFKLAFFRQDWSTELVPVPFPRVTATQKGRALGCPTSSPAQVVFPRPPITIGNGHQSPSIPVTPVGGAMSTSLLSME